MNHYYESNTSFNLHDAPAFHRRDVSAGRDPTFAPPAIDEKSETGSSCVDDARHGKVQAFRKGCAHQISIAAVAGALSAADTGASVHDALALLGATALLETLAAMAAGSVTPVPQPPEGVTYAPKIEKTEARIDWGQDAAAIARQVRAFNPWPVAETTLDGEQLRIYGAHPSDDMALTCLVML